MIDVLPVPTDLGLRPGGVTEGAEALLDLGVARRLSARVLAAIPVPTFDPKRDPTWGVPNIDSVAEVARAQAEVLRATLANGRFPIVLGGDDSVLFGCLLALNDARPTGMLFLDGHTDFWDTRDGDGELSDSDLWIATGHGPEQLAHLAGDDALVAAKHCVVYGHRDRPDQLAKNSQDVYEYPMLVRSFAEIRAAGPEAAGSHARAWLEPLGPRRVWLHLDADCLDDNLMPAVDWRLAEGLSVKEVMNLIRPTAEAGLLAGMDVTIYNPSRDDPNRSAGALLVDLVTQIAQACNVG